MLVDEVPEKQINGMTCPQDSWVSSIISGCHFTLQIDYPIYYYIRVTINNKDKLWHDKKVDKLLLWMLFTETFPMAPCPMHGKSQERKMSVDTKQSLVGLAIRPK